ncbi:hypothetical protein FRC11_003323, partial [Ceratobasidium sp. 423]
MRPGAAAYVLVVCITRELPGLRFPMYDGAPKTNMNEDDKTGGGKTTATTGVGAEEEIVDRERGGNGRSEVRTRGSVSHASWRCG